MRAFGRVVGGLIALSALAALLVGVPWALWHYIGWPLPHALPTWEQVSQALTSNGIPDELLFNLLAVVCWTAWAGLAASIAAETWAAIHGVAARRIPLTGPMQALARHLVAAVLVLLPAVSPRLAVAGPLQVTTSTARSVTAVAAPLIVAPTGAHQAAGGAAGLALVADADLPRHQVAPKETLWGLAERFLGDPLRWHEIFELNQGRPQPNGERLTDEDLIRPGWVLLLPADARVPDTVPPSGAGSRSNGQQGSGAPMPGEEVPPAPRPPERPSTTTAPEHQEHHPSDHVIQLPLGGVVGLSLAAAISVALVYARLHRRRRWQPTGSTPDISRDDPLVTDTIRLLDRAAKAAIRQDDDDDGREEPPSGDAESVGPPRVESGPFGVVTVAHRDGKEVMLDLPDAEGLSLTGPGAQAAVRALLVTALARNRQNAAVEIVVAGTNLAEDLLPAVRAVPGLKIVADLDAALRHLEVEALYRARLLDVSDEDTIKTFRDNHPAEPLPLLMLVAGTPEPIFTGRLAALLDSAQRYGIGVVIVGEAKGVDAVAVGAEGEIAELPTGPGPLDLLRGARMMMLHPDQGREALALLAASHGEPPVPLTGSPAAAVATFAPAATDTTSPSAAAHPAPRPRPPRMPAPAEGESRPILVRLLGQPRIEVNGREIRKGLRGKARELLALLLINPEGIDTEVTVETLWPDATPPRGAERFQTTLSNLRVTLRTATGLEKAAAEGEEYGWVEPPREELRRRALEAATALADLHERNSETAPAIAILEQAVTWDPYAEELYRRLMRLNASLRRLDEIRRLFQRLTDRLDELDADPDEATQQLFQELTGPTVRRIR